MDMSVLERQRLVHHKRRHHHHQQQNQHSTNRLDHHQQLQLSHSSNWYPPQPLDKSQQMNHYHHSNTINNASMSRVCNDNTSSSIKKRKPEFHIEEDESGEKLYGSTEEEQGGGEDQSEITVKTDRENSTNETSKVSEVQKPDYIHVRARRGQATDSHSLAERARREKISKKMKCLQDLVPGCNKVTGKAGMLDEIINYVQSLQKQVEFLSMKLAVSNPRLDFNIDNLFTKEIPAYIASLHAAATQLEANNLTCFQYNQMQMNQPQKEGSSSLPTSEAFLDPSCIPQLQQLPGWDSEWTSQFNLGFH